MMEPSRLSNALIVVLLGIIVSYLPSPVVGGMWEGKSCSKEDRSLLVSQVRKCGSIAPISKTSKTMVTARELTNAQALCSPGCTCQQNSNTQGTLLQFAPEGRCSEGCCAAEAEIVAFQGALFFLPGTLCRAGFLNGCECAANTCRFRCDNIESKSCLAQLEESVGGTSSSSGGTSNSTDSDPSSSGSDKGSVGSDTDEEGGDSNNGVKPNEADGEGSKEKSEAEEKPKDEDSSDKKLSTVEIVGIVGGSVVGLLTLAVAVFAFILQWRDRQGRAEGQGP